MQPHPFDGRQPEAVGTAKEPSLPSLSANRERGGEGVRLLEELGLVLGAPW